MIRAAALTAVVATLALFWPAGSSACACGEFSGPTVAQGVSPMGVPWRIEAWRSERDLRGRRGLEVHFSFDEPAFSGVGWFSGLPLPLPPSYTFHATSGEEISPFPESDLGGIARANVVTLRVKMTDGSILMIYPSLAPDRLRQRLPWLRGLRFFDVFYPAGPRPRLVTAFDRDGEILDRKRSKRGSFHS